MNGGCIRGREWERIGGEMIRGEMGEYKVSGGKMGENGK
jgi:hypothetical protein